MLMAIIIAYNSCFLFYVPYFHIYLPICFKLSLMKIHIDLDAFFVSAERTQDPSLCHKPVGIGGRGDQSIFASRSGHQSLQLENSGAFVGTFFQTYDAQGDDMQKFTDPDGRIRGILTTASYEARAFGIHTGMSIKEALQRVEGALAGSPRSGIEALTKGVLKLMSSRSKITVKSPHAPGTLLPTKARGVY